MWPTRTVTGFLIYEKVEHRNSGKTLDFANEVFCKLFWKKDSLQKEKVSPGMCNHTFFFEISDVKIELPEATTYQKVSL